MHPVLIKLGPLSIYSYGVMVALGFGIATFLLSRRAPKFNLDKDAMLDLAIVLFIAGIVGARLLYVLLHFDYYRSNPFEIPNLAKGGLVWYGGFIFAFFVMLLYLKKKHLDFWQVTDLMAPCVALAQGFGRIGCLLNGCCYGVVAPSGYPFGLAFPAEPITRHPTQVYSAVALFLIFIVLRRWQERRHFAGEIFLGYCILYSLKRFLIEFLRADNPRIILNLTLSQAISTVILAIALAAFTYKAIKWKRKNLGSR